MSHCIELRTRKGIHKNIPGITGWAQVADHYQRPLVFSVHPRMADNLARFGLDPQSDRVRLLKPLGFFDFMRLEQTAGSVCQRAWNNNPFWATKNNPPSSRKGLSTCIKNVYCSFRRCRRKENEWSRLICGMRFTVGSNSGRPRSRLPERLG